MPGSNALPPIPQEKCISAMSDKGGCVKPCHLTIDYPQSDFYPLHPPNYGCGFSRDGRIIGSNLAVPYPRDLAWYHDIPFRRAVDWFASGPIGDSEHEAWEFLRTKNAKRPGGSRDGCEHCEWEKTSAQPTTGSGGKQGCGRHKMGNGETNSCEGAAEEGKGTSEDNQSATKSCGESWYPSSYIVKDDASYKAWVDGKLDAQRARDKVQEDMKTVPWGIKLYPGHFAPSIMRTTNETYGQHLDMLPKYPLVYPEVEFEYEPLPLFVRYRRSNMSDHPPIPDHPFIVPRSELESQDGKLLPGNRGAPITPDQPLEKREPGFSANTDLKKPESGKAENKIPTVISTKDLKTVVGGSGVSAPAPGIPAADPWTFRRSAVVLGRVVGERERGCTWPAYTPTGLELNRPVPRRINMTSGFRHSEEAPQNVKLPTDSKAGVYNTTDPPSQLSGTTRKVTCAPRDVRFGGFSRQQPCHRDFFNLEMLPQPGSCREDFHCNPRSNPTPCDK